MSEFGRNLAITVSGAALIAAAGCSGETSHTNQNNNGGVVVQETPGNKIDQAYQEGLRKIESFKNQVNVDLCVGRLSVDSDCDGVIEEYDRLPGRADFGDDDGDWIVNVFDKYPDFDDKKIDSDGDSLWDCFDDFVGNNFADTDRDEIEDGNDLQPLVPQQRTTANQDKRLQATTYTIPNDVANLAVTTRMGNAAFKELMSNDETPVPVKSKIPNALKTDSDHDGYVDYFDTQKRNPYITPKNDVYNIGGDAWRDKQAEKRREKTPATR